jgi:hypothetical protein
MLLICNAFDLLRLRLNVVVHVDGWSVRSSTVGTVRSMDTQHGHCYARTAPRNHLHRKMLCPRPHVPPLPYPYPLPRTHTPHAPTNNHTHTHTQHTQHTHTHSHTHTPNTHTPKHTHAQGDWDGAARGHPARLVLTARRGGAVDAGDGSDEPLPGRVLPLGPRGHRLHSC